MKKLIGITVLAAVIFAGCNTLGAIINPIIGTWETEMLGVTVEITFNANKTLSENNSLGQVGVTRTGTWTSDSDTLTKTWDDATVDEFTYTFNADKSRMTLTPVGVGLSVTYDRQ